MADPRIEYQHFQISPDAVLYLRAGNEANRNAQIMMWARQVSSLQSTIIFRLLTAPANSGQ